MFYGVDLPDGSPAAICMGRETRARLATTCFRGPRVACAGNLFRWHTPEAVFAESDVLRPFLKDVLDTIEENENRNARASVTIHLNRNIGWASTAPRERFEEMALEPFEPNRKSCALRVRPYYRELLAPQTSDLTIVYQVSFVSRKGWKITIWSIYPGQDIGEVRGDITEEEGIVFFDWTHPGA